MTVLKLAKKKQHLYPFGDRTVQFGQIRGWNHFNHIKKT